MNVPSLDSIAKLVAVLAGFAGIIKILYEMQQGRELRARELRWKQAQAAKELNDKMLADKEVVAALLMLDWNGREFEVKPGQREAIASEDMVGALRTTRLDFTDKEAYIRDCFDMLFYYLGLFEHYIRRGLVDPLDLEHPIEYYVRILGSKRAAFEPYLAEYGFDRAKSFLERFPSWRGGTDAATSGRMSGRPDARGRAEARPVDA